MPKPQELIGKRIDRYQVLECIGKGGMAVVYKVFDTRRERNYSLKMIRKDAFPAEYHQTLFKRFEIEARSLGLMEHPNIVKSYDFGYYDGSPYFVMELIEGGTLKNWLGSPIPYQLAAKVLTPIADGLAAAHRQGILHRDVKPANILIRTDSSPVLTDFGIAKMLDIQEGYTLTAAGMGIGTPEYMAPEQGFGLEVDGRADIYSLGVIFWEAVTGRRPYIADTPMEVLFMQRAEPLPNPQTIVPDLPDKVVEVISKAMAKKPEDRYATMDEFRDELNVLATGSPEIISQMKQKPVEKKPTTTETQPITSQENEYGKTESKKKRTVLLTVLAIIGIVIAVFGKTVGLPFLQQSPTATFNATQEDLFAPLFQTQTAWNLALTKSLKEIALTNTQAFFDLRKTGTAEAVANQTQIAAHYHQTGTAEAVSAGQTLVAQENAAKTLAVSATNQAKTEGPIATVRAQTAEVSAMERELATLQAQFAFQMETATAFHRFTDTPVPTPKPKLGIGSSFIREEDGGEMVYVPEGSFLMGRDISNQGPSHRVYLDAYWIDKTEVTNGQYAVCVDEGPCTRVKNATSNTRGSYFGNGQYKDYPVINVDWEQAQTFCNWVGGSLPTEAQWEKAARSDDERIYSWGNSSGNGNANLMPSSDTEPVCSYSTDVSPYGACDMMGNVSEWVSDWYAHDYSVSSSTTDNPTGPGSGTYRAGRGGGFFHEPSVVAVTYRYGEYATSVYPSHGFRCAMPAWKKR